MLNIENITPMVNIENGEIETPATLFRYLVPEVPVVPVAHKNLISDILVSSAFQKYITPMVNTEKNLIQGTCNTFQIPSVPEIPGTSSTYGTCCT